MSPARKREAVAHLERKLQVSQRRACKVIGQPRSTQRYAARRPARDAKLVAKLRRYALNYVGLSSQIELVVYQGQEVTGAWTGKGQWETYSAKFCIESAIVSRALIEIDISRVLPTIDSLLQKWLPPD